MKSWVLKIHGTKTQVKIVPPSRFDGNRFGESDTRKREIYISADGDDATKIQTIIHEWWHFYETDMYDELEEEEIQKRTMMLYWFLTENGVDLSPLLGGKNGKQQ